MSPCASTSTETNRLSPARRSISSTARSGACIGTTIEARSRESFDSHSAAIQSLIALQKAGRHIGIEHRLRAVEHIADGVAGAELVERAALHHREIAARLAIGRPPVGAARKRHVRRIGIEIEAVDGAADHLLFPVIVEIGQQRGAGSAHRGMDIAVDPRGRHGVSLDIRFLGVVFGDLCTSRLANVPPTGGQRKGQARQSGRGSGMAGPRGNQLLISLSR